MYLGLNKLQVANGKWQIDGHFVPVVRMPDPRKLRGEQ